MVLFTAYLLQQLWVCVTKCHITDAGAINSLRLVSCYTFNQAIAVAQVSLAHSLIALVVDREHQ